MQKIIFSQLYPDQIETANTACRILGENRAVMLTDATGTGKTYIACAIMAYHQHLHHSHAVVIAPAHLRQMWISMMHKYSIKAEFYSYQDASLGSIPKPAQNDLLFVMDEAHMLKNPATKRYRAIYELTANHRVCLMTATPISMNPQDLFALAHMCGFPDHQQYRHDEVIRAFALALMPQSRTGALRLPAQQSVRYHEHAMPIGQNPADAADLLNEFAQITWHVMDADGQVSRADIITQVLLHRLLSHPVSCLASLAKLETYYRASRLGNKGSVLTRSQFAKILGCDGTQRLLPFAETLFGAKVAPSDRQSLEQSLIHIQKAAEILKFICQNNDLRINAIKKMLASFSSERKIIMFTQYADTAEYYAQNLQSAGDIGLLTAQTALFNGIPIDRQILIAMFDPNMELPGFWKENRLKCAQILVCTDAFACGHNLHRANVLIHLDMPWNPATLHQREGRIVRLGQNAHVDIFRPVTVNAPDALIAYENRHRHRLQFRQNLMLTWSRPISQSPFEAILVIESPDFPKYWGKYSQRWFVLPYSDIDIIPDSPHQNTTFAIAFATMIRSCKKTLSPVWAQLKAKSHFVDNPQPLNNFIHLAWLAAFFPKITITIENIKHNQHITFKLPPPDTPCQIYPIPSSSTSQQSTHKLVHFSHKLSTGLHRQPTA